MDREYLDQFSDREIVDNLITAARHYEWIVTTQPVFTANAGERQRRASAHLDAITQEVLRRLNSNSNSNSNSGKGN